MSKRYSIDDPVMDDDLEEDIVLGSFNPTDGDRDLLRADEAVLNDIQKKSSSGFKDSRFFSGKGLMSKYKNLIKESKSSKKRVGFAPLDTYDEPSSSSRGNKGYSKLDGYPESHLPLHNDKHANNKHRRELALPDGLEDYDVSDSEDESDIEIDISDGLSRGELRRKARRFQGVVLIIVAVVFLWLAYKEVIPSSSTPNNDSKFRHYVPPAPAKVLSNGTHEFKPTTILVSLDGFHPHYVNEEITPNLHKLMTQGGGAPYMIPSFPSSTFPNHWSMITGLYPANHGIVGNTFYDTTIQKQFFNTKPAQSLDREWWGGQPIWITAGQQDVPTAVHMWPGSEVAWDEGSMLEVDKYNATETLENRTKRVLSWIDREKNDRPELILAYVPTIDEIGHQFGIAGQELMDALKDVDSVVGGLMDGISQRNLTDIVNLVVVSDHGMSPTSNDRLIYLDNLLEMDNIDRIDGWPLIAIRPKSSIHLDSLYQNLVEAQKLFGEGKWDVYLREDLPEEWNFGGKYYNKYSERLAPLWLVPRVGWAFTTKEQMEKLGGDYKPHGIHGYNNTEVLMRSLFVAQGPYFSNEFVMPFENVGVYKILCGSLGIKPAKTDGPSFTEIFRILPSNWTDTIEYPDVPFKTEILTINSTYDTLFGDHQAVENIEDITGHEPTPNADENVSEQEVNVEVAEPKEQEVNVEVAEPKEQESDVEVAEPKEQQANEDSVEEQKEESNEPSQTEPQSDDTKPSSKSESDDSQKSSESSESSESSDAEDEDEKEAEWWNEWYDYFSGKAQKAGEWVSNKVDKVLEHFGSNDSDKEEEEADQQDNTTN